MKITNLAVLGAGVAGVSALSTIGAQLARNAHRNFGNILLLGAVLFTGLGAFILPFMAAAHLVSFHAPLGKSYFVEIIWKSYLTLQTGAILLYVVCAAYLLIKFPGPASVIFAYPRFQSSVFSLMIFLIVPTMTFGLIYGLLKRRKQKKAYSVYVYNQKFLDQIGFQEYKGSRFSHVDGAGNKLNLTGQGKDFIEFAAVNGQDAFLLIGPEGRFSEYVKPSI